MSTKLEVPCSGCSTDPCYHWPYCTELLSLRAENQALTEKLRRWEAIDLGKIDAIVDLQAENERLRAALDAALQQNERFAIEIKRLRDHLESKAW